MGLEYSYARLIGLALLGTASQFCEVVVLVARKNRL
jgi:hypothetical protein